MKRLLTALSMFAASCAMADGGATWYLVDSDDSKFEHQSWNNANWWSSDGTTSGEKAGKNGDSLPVDDLYVVRNKKNLRSRNEEHGSGDKRPTVFSCKRLTIGEDGSGQYGGFLSYCKKDAYVDFGSGSDQDGVYLHNGFIGLYRNYNVHYDSYFTGKMTLTAPESNPFYFVANAINSEFYVTGTTFRAECGTALVVGGLRHGLKSTTVTDFN